MVTAVARRAAVAHVQTAVGVSERRACRWLGVHRSPIRYVPHPLRDYGPLRDRLRALTQQHPRWGAPLLTWALQREGWADNHKRIERVYRQDWLAVRKRARKKLTRPRTPHTPSLQPKERWSMDFMRDTLASGRVFRLFTVVDDCTREALAIEVEASFPGARVAQALDAIATQRGRYPAEIVCDNGPEFISRALAIWAANHEVVLRHIQPGKPNQNAYIERFNGRVRDECLNQHWFLTLADARRTLTTYQGLYNTGRRHGVLRGLTPREFAATFAEVSKANPSSNLTD